LLVELKSVEDTSWLQLFIKNTALCKHESGRIRCDAYTSFLTSQSPVFLVNSRLGLFIATPSRFRSKSIHASGAPLLPKLRGQFAEFLNEGSHLRLRIFSSPTCVGLRYGYLKHSLEAFLGSVASMTLRIRRSSLRHLRISDPPDFPGGSPYMPRPGRLAALTRLT